MCNSQNYEGNFSLSDKKVEDLIELMPYLEQLFLRGGEVFFDKRIYKILEEAKKNRVKMDLITNGLLLNEDIIKQIIGLDANLTISVDSVIKEKYEKIRVGAKFEKLISNIELLTNIIKEKNADTYLYLNMVVMSINYMEIENVLDFAGKYGFKGVQLLPPILFENQHEYSLNRYMVSLLSQKKHIYSNIAKKYGIVLINKLPEVIGGKDNVCVVNNIDVNNSTDKTEDVNEKELFDYKSKVQTNMKILDNNQLSEDIHKNKTDYKNIKVSYNNRLFCLEPFKKILVDNLQARATCLCINEKCM